MLLPNFNLAWRTLSREVASKLTLLKSILDSVRSDFFPEWRSDLAALTQAQQSADSVNPKGLNHRQSIARRTTRRCGNFACWFPVAWNCWILWSALSAQGLGCCWNQHWWWRRNPTGPHRYFDCSTKSLDLALGVEKDNPFCPFRTTSVTGILGGSPC